MLSFYTVRSCERLHKVGHLARPGAVSYELSARRSLLSSTRQKSC